MTDERNPNEEKPVADEAEREATSPHPIEIAHSNLTERVENYSPKPIIKRVPVIIVAEFYAYNRHGALEPLHVVDDAKLIEHWENKKRGE